VTALAEQAAPERPPAPAAPRDSLPITSTVAVPLAAGLLWLAGLSHVDLREIGPWGACCRCCR